MLKAEQVEQVTQTKTYELERRVQQIEERCDEIRRTQMTILQIITSLQRASNN